MKIITVISGFITNSSSVINGFDREIFEDSRVQELLTKYGVQRGFIGEDLTSRGSCGSLLVSHEQKTTAQRELNGGDPMFSANVSFDNSNIYVMYGDEYESLAREISELMCTITDEKKKNYSSWDVH